MATGAGAVATGSSGGGGATCEAVGSTGATTGGAAGGGMSGLVTLAQPQATTTHRASVDHSGIGARKTDMNSLRYEVGKINDAELRCMGGAPQ
jgi:hypothetical protein